MDKNLRVPVSSGAAVVDTPSKGLRKELSPGNREIITDLYISSPAEDEQTNYAFKVYVRLNGRKQTIRKVSFQHSIFEGAILTPAHLIHATLQDADLSLATFTDLHLRAAILNMRLSSAAKSMMTF